MFMENYVKGWGRFDQKNDGEKTGQQKKKNSFRKVVGGK